MDRIEFIGHQREYEGKEYVQQQMIHNIFWDCSAGNLPIKTVVGAVRLEELKSVHVAWIAETFVVQLHAGLQNVQSETKRLWA